MKRLLCGLFITTILLSITSCGMGDGSESKMDSGSGIQMTTQTEGTSEME